MSERNDETARWLVLPLTIVSLAIWLLALRTCDAGTSFHQHRMEAYALNQAQSLDRIADAIDRAFPEVAK